MITKVGFPLPSVLHKMKMKKVSKENLQLFGRAFGLSRSKNEESIQAVEGTEKEENDVKLEKIFFSTPCK